MQCFNKWLPNNFENKWATKKIPSITRVSNNTKSSVSPPPPHPRSHLHVSFSWEFSHARWSLVTPMGARREAEKQPDHTCHQVSGDHHPPHSAVTSIHTVTPYSTSNKCTDPQLKKLIHWKKHSLQEAEQHSRWKVREAGLTWRTKKTRMQSKTPDTATHHVVDNKNFLFSDNSNKFNLCFSSITSKSLPHWML